MRALSVALLLVPLAASAQAPAGYYSFQKVVYQNDGGWPDDHAHFTRLLRNLTNHLNAVDDRAQIHVVDFGSGVKLFQMANTDQSLAASIDALRGRGVRFLICHNTLEGMGLTPAALYKVSVGDVVPSGVAEVARLQGLGFVYLHP